MSRPPVVGLFVVGLSALGFALGGLWGAATVSVAVTVVVAVIARVRVPGPIRPAPARLRDGPAPDFPSHQRISSMISWSSTNGHHYDMVTRPFLRSTAAAVLADRCHLDLSRDPDAAARRLGPEVMALLDPAVVHDRTQTANLQTIGKIVDRMEKL
jgi:hypothetical protein